ncbi:hypothetical protein EON63_01350 [archaeon]|nr:MAG: hypothetical protein EON63_01350 [archaeon]
MGSLFFSRAMNILSMHPALIPPQLQVYFDERWKQYMDWRKGEGEDRLFWIPPPLPTHLPPVLTIQQRSRPSNEGAHQYERYWSNETLTKVYDAAKLAFPEHLVYTMSSLSQVSLAVEVLVYSVTTVLVGAHGAGRLDVCLP